MQLQLCEQTIGYPLGNVLPLTNKQATADSSFSQDDSIQFYNAFASSLDYDNFQTFNQTSLNDANFNLGGGTKKHSYKGYNACTVC